MKKFKRQKEITEIVRRNWDVDFYNDIINNDGFVITEPAVISFDGKKERSEFGPQSPLYGTTYGDEQAFMERHRCKCGEFKGLQFRGEICPLCNTKVESREMDIKKHGWISLGKEKILNPYYYQVLMRVIGKKVFPEIVERSTKVDADGNQHELVPGVDFEPQSPFAAIGIDGFCERYEEILDYFAKKKKDKRDDIEILKREKAKVFTSHIPIYSTFLRPQSVTQDTFYYNGLDKQINPAIRLANAIKESSKNDGVDSLQKPFLQTRLQRRVNNMWQFNFELIESKKGFIRNKLIAGSLNYTSRAVIIPDPTLKCNEIDISYQAFRILFKNKIIYWLMKLNDIPLSEAYYRWKGAYKYDSYVHKVMNYIVMKESPRILLNRNPTLNYYSMLLLRIRRVKGDWKRTTLSVPLGILAGLNADFDGDVLNMIAVFDKALIRMFRNFDPIEKFVMSKKDCKLNDLFSINKGQKTDLYNFFTFEEDDDLEPVEEDKLMEIVERFRNETYYQHENKYKMTWNQVDDIYHEKE